MSAESADKTALSRADLDTTAVGFDGTPDV
jgi:hypothetical protein